MENETVQGVTQGAKKHDLVDYVLAAVVVVSAVTICTMCYQGREIPEFLQTLFWSSGSGLGFYRANVVKI